MKYKILLTSREWWLWNDEKYKKYEDIKKYDTIHRIGLTTEAWDNDIPVYLHDIFIFYPDDIIEKARGKVTEEPVFDIFDLKNLTFEQMIKEIWKRRKEIVKVVEGDDNPYLWGDEPPQTLDEAEKYLTEKNDI